jgi:upstream activation factor subunit UAF30
MDNVVVSDVVEHSISVGFTDFIGRFQSLITQFNTLKTELRNLEKTTTKQLKIAQKLNNKKRRKGSRAPSGFVRPSLISDELATFLGKPAGSEMARTDVTREINKYIRANNLQDKENGRKIIPDKLLKTLLKLEDSVELTYFNLQKYMGPHFPKVVKVVPVDVPVPVPVM